MKGSSFAMVIGVALAAWLLAGGEARAQHSHINAGFQDANGNNQPNAGEKLRFTNGDQFVEGSGFVAGLGYKAVGQEYGGMYSIVDLTFTALAATPAFGGPQPGHAALGSFIRLEIVSVEGPPGALFGFWEYDRFPYSFLTPGVIIPTGTMNAGVSFDLSDYRIYEGTLPPPGEDPFGHVHDRAFSVNTPGTYRVRFRLFDGSTNGPGAGPIHTPGDLFTMLFEAPDGEAIAPGLALARSGNNIVLSFPTVATKDYVVKSSTDGLVWKPLGLPFRERISGNGETKTVTDTNPSAVDRVKLYQLFSIDKS